MIRKVIIASLSFVVLYIGIIQLQVHFVSRVPKKQASEKESDVLHKVYAFSFSKYTADGKKEIEIEGDSANILTQTVDLMNVVAKAYAEEVPVTITADQGSYDKTANMVHLQKNVVATTENGTRLLTEELDIHPAKQTMETEVMAEIKKDNINVKGLGAQGDSQLKKVQFKKKVTVMVQDPDAKDQGPTVITCDGPLVVDYEKNIAHFKDNVEAQDARGKLTADVMDVYYNKVTRRVSKIVAIGNVVIENPDGNKTYSDNVIYLADEGRVIFGGDAEALYVEGSKTDVSEKGLFPS
ncbi:MAG: LPS export ABC transporter periplasmic protein LptC [Candidatus Omnitrophica bacterium]|nr:LPS export ABC transporter periplasmic protein LptC [Candidatus Omnitrophota bacterium]